MKAYRLPMLERASQSEPNAPPFKQNVNETHQCEHDQLHSEQNAAMVQMILEEF